MAPEPLRFSVIVASWQRAVWLRRCLRAVRALDYPAFEVVVVADHAALESIDRSGFKTVAVSKPNLAAARNTGIAAAGGDVCAFIDDDAVPEPLWLQHLAEAFGSTGADAVKGYVRGRNGISFQSKVASVDAEAETHEEPDRGEDAFVPELSSGRALKLIGTNMAFRREVLAAVGGFDGMLRYYLDDADISLRLARAGRRLAVAPLAEVHHAYAPSARRTGLRAPVDLTDIGRSTAIFLRRHAGRADPEIVDRILLRERARMIRHMVAGTCEPRDVGTRLATLESGWSKGVGVSLAPLGKLSEKAPPFDPLTPMPPGHAVKSARLFLNRRTALRGAEDIADHGGRVTLFSFSLTPVRHRLCYTPSGVWLQTGGIWGRSIRTDRRFVWCRFANRVRQEIGRVAKVRGFKDSGSP